MGSQDLSPREAAVRVMNRLTGKDGKTVDISGEISALVSGRLDKALANEIVKGTLRHLVSIDFELKSRSNTPLNKLKPAVLNTLRTSLYQIRYLDRVPASAVCNEGVRIANKFTGNSLGGYVNAVLRNAVREGFSPGDSAGPEVAYEIPSWMLGSWTKYYGKETAVRIAEGFKEKPSDFVRVNTLKIQPDRLKETYPDCFSEESGQALRYIRKGSVLEADGFGKGFYHFQNLSSQLVCGIISPQPGERVLDACAAPGGKSFTMAELMGNQGSITSLDVSDEKTERIRTGAERLGIKIIKAFTADASIFADEEKFDTVLCDVPCSGLGLLRKRPEIILKTQGEIENLPEIQLKILTNCSKLVRSGGRLFYSTCTLNRAENNSVIEKFLAENRGFSRNELGEIPGPGLFIENGCLTILPDSKYEGFFIAAMKRD